MTNEQILDAIAEKSVMEIVDLISAMEKSLEYQLQPQLLHLLLVVTLVPLLKQKMSLM